MKANKDFLANLPHGTVIGKSAAESGMLDVPSEALAGLLVAAYACHTIVIPDYLPPSLGILLHRSWREKYRLKKECLAMVVAYGHKTPRATGKRRVRLTLTMSGRRKFMDADNTKKAILDALVACRLLVDDSPEWCVCEDPIQVRGEKSSTQIELEDIQ